MDGIFGFLKYARNILWVYRIVKTYVLFFLESYIDGQNKWSEVAWFITKKLSNVLFNLSI